MSDSRSIRILIVTYNSINEISACLESVYDTQMPQIQVTIIDNNSVDNTVEYVKNTYPQIEVIETGFNVFAHSDELVDITHNAFSILKKNGTFIVEVQYLLDTINDLTFDNIYHEHANYWSVTSLNNFFDKLGYTLYKVEHVDTHGGSIRAYVGRYFKKVDSSVNKFLNKEKDFGMLIYDTYRQFAKNVKKCKTKTLRNLRNLKKDNKIIVGYGSPAKATTTLNYYGISTDYIDYIIEDNELKHNLFIPGVRIPIKHKNAIESISADFILVLAWNFFDSIKENNKDLAQGNPKFINIKDLQS
jgi:hypothetical protein